MMHGLQIEDVTTESTKRVKLLGEVLTHNEKETLRHALDVASRTFQSNIYALNEAQPGGFVTAEAIPWLRDQFEHYLSNTLALLEKIECGGAADVLAIGELQEVR